MSKRTLLGTGVLAALAALVCDAASGDDLPDAAPPPPPAAAPTQPATAPASGMHLIPPKTPDESARLLRVRDGYVVELMAAEPLVADPVAFSWGTDGRLWVVEMADYPYGGDGKMKPAGRVRFLRDTNNDGRYDESVLFAADLNFPTGVLPWHNGVIVTAAPDILYLEDSDGDGKADVRRVIYTGFSEGNPQLRVASPTYGLDGWVHLANGLGSKGVVTSIKSGQSVNVSGRDVRIHPDSGAIETETGQSQFGKRADDFGDWFGVHNSYPVRHFVLPERYVRRNPLATLPPGLTDMGTGANPKVFPISQGQKRYGRAFFEQSGHYTSACSVTPVRDPFLFGAGAFDGPRQVFACEPVHNLIQHLTLTPAGATFTAARAADDDGEFLASEDPWFRPVYTDVGPDGGLWVADMYRFMIEHPDWLPAEGKEDYRPFHRLGDEKGRIYRVRRVGADPRPAKPLDKMTTPELVAELNTPNGSRRDLVRAMLVWKADPKATALLEGVALSGPEPLGRMAALATLEASGSLRPAVVERALSDDEPAVRRLALVLAEPRAMASPTLLTAALDRLSDPEPKVRLQLAFSLGAWDGVEAGEALVTLAMHAGDDPYLPAAVLTSASRHVPALVDAVLAPRVAPPPALLSDLLAMTLSKGDRDGSARLIDPILTPPHGWSAADRYAAIGRLLDVMERLRTSAAKLSAVKADDALGGKLAGLADVFAAARTAAADAERPVDERVAAIALLGRDPRGANDDFNLLTDLLAVNDPAPAAPAAVEPPVDAANGNPAPAAAPPADPWAVRSAAIRTLVRNDRPATADVLLAQWPGRPPVLRTVILDVLVGKEASATRVLEDVRAGRIRPTDVDATRRQRLLRHGSAAVRTLAAKVFNEAADGSRAKVVESYRGTAAVAGDVVRGRRVFAENCATCHRFNDIGVEVGPNLQSVVGWPTEALVTAVLDPSRSAEPRYLGYAATLETGEAVYGLVVRETPAGVTMKTLDGAERTIPRTQLRTLDPTQRSLMPDGIEAQVSVQQMADLIAYMRATP